MRAFVAVIACLGNLGELLSQPLTQMIEALDPLQFARRVAEPKLSCAEVNALVKLRARGSIGFW